MQSLHHLGWNGVNEVNESRTPALNDEIEKRDLDMSTIMQMAVGNLRHQDTSGLEPSRDVGSSTPSC